VSYRLNAASADSFGKCFCWGADSAGATACWSCGGVTCLTLSMLYSGARVGLTVVALLASTLASKRLNHGSIKRFISRRLVLSGRLTSDYAEFLARPGAISKVR